MDSRASRTILIVSASMGGGHDGVANELRRRLSGGGHEVHIVDFLDLVELHVGWLLAVIYQAQLRLAPWSYQLIFRLSSPLRRPAAALDMWLTRRKLSRRVRELQPDVIVSVYPLSSLALGRMRRKGLLQVPVITYLTDFSVHPMWVDRGVDWHLAVSHESARQAVEVGAGATLVRGPLVGPAFSGRAADRTAMRDQLGLAEDDRAVLIVAGSWGAGDVGRTLAEIVSTGRLHPIVVCGRNERLRADLDARGIGTIIGWTDQMPSLMAAVDAVVENAGGLTCMEAFAAGVPVVTYLPIPGHGRVNAAAMASSGVNLYAQDAEELSEALQRVTEPGATRDDLVRKAATLFVGDPALDVEQIAASCEPAGRRRPLRHRVSVASLSEL